MTQYKFTQARIDRQANEHRSHGKYATTNPCELCGKSAGINFFSLESMNEDGVGQFICPKCAKKIAKEQLTDKQVKEMIKAREHNA